MAVIHTSQADIGLESAGHGRKYADDVVYRLWIDKGRGKYRTVEITYAEMQRLHKMIGGVLGGSRSKPSRRRSVDAEVHS